MLVFRIHTIQLLNNCRVSSANQNLKLGLNRITLLGSGILIHRGFAHDPFLAEMFAWLKYIVRIVAAGCKSLEL